MATCRLCLKEKKLCDSHIFPEYMYTHCYDENHKYNEFNAKIGEFNKRRPQGIYEPLLCKKCEEIIQIYEDHAKIILYKRVKPLIRSNQKPCTIDDYDYLKFKLFVLSLLWRASVSNHDMYKLISLGKYENKLRELLLHKQNTPVDMFPSYLYQTLINDELADGVFLEIHSSKAKIGGKTIYQFIADGIFFFVGVGCLSLKTFKNGSSVSPENLRVGIDQLNKLDKFNDIFDRLNQQGKFSVYERVE